VSLHQWGLNGAVDCGARMFFVLLLSLVINYECFFLSFFQGIDSHLLNPRVLDTQILCLASSSLVSRLSSLKNKIKQWHVHLVNLIYIYICLEPSGSKSIYIFIYINIWEMCYWHQYKIYDTIGGPLKEEGVVGWRCQTRVTSSAARNRIKRLEKNSPRHVAQTYSIQS